MAPPARFPHVPAAAAHYESFYLKACHPRGGVAVWIRYTVHKRPGNVPKGFAWFTLFDAAAGIAACKEEFGRPDTGADRYIDMDGCRFAPGRVVGRALASAWELRFESHEAPLWHLPWRWMYRAPFPRTKIVSPFPRATFTGWVDAGGRRIDLAGWPGMVGHNWGAEHARRSIWMHATNFPRHEDAWLDVAIGRVGVGPLTTPWIANGALFLDGRRHRLGGSGRSRVEERVEACGFTLRGEDVRVKGEVGAPRERFVGWIYAQPDSGERQTINSSIADLRVEVARSGAPPVTLELAGSAAYELQMEEPYPAIPVQPFPDG